MANCTNNLQKNIEEAVNGQTIEIQHGTYELSKNLTWSDKTLNILGVGQVVLKKTFTEEAPMIQGINAGQSKISNLHLVSDDFSQYNHGPFNGAVRNNENWSGIYFENSPEVLVENIRVDNRITGISLTGSAHSTVRNLTGTGFGDRIILSGNAPNWHQLLRICSSDKTTVRGLRSDNYGSAILVTSYSSKLAELKPQIGVNINNLRSTRSQDHAVYITKGSNRTVVNDAQMSGGPSSLIRIDGDVCSISNAIGQDGNVVVSVRANDVWLESIHGYDMRSDVVRFSEQLSNRKIIQNARAVHLTGTRVGGAVIKGTTNFLSAEDIQALEGGVAVSLSDGRQNSLDNVRSFNTSVHSIDLVRESSPTIRNLNTLGSFTQLKGERRYARLVEVSNGLFVDWNAEGSVLENVTCSHNLFSNINSTGTNSFLGAHTSIISVK